MKNTLKKLNLYKSKLNVYIILIVLVSITASCIDGVIKDGDRIILGFDKSKNRILFFEEKEFNLDGIDGPYIIDDKIIRVNSKNNIIIKPIQNDSIEVFVKNSNAKFIVEMQKDFNVPSSNYELPNKLVAISDIEGNFNAFYGFLLKNKVIDKNFNWIFNNGHLVLLGDFVDRGDNVIPILWLIYKLEYESRKFGGKVHFILGNHEIMNIQGNFKYVRDRYKKLSQIVFKYEDDKKNYLKIYSIKSHLGAWLRSKNIVEKIGEYLFLHAGLSPDILNLNINLKEINNILRNNIDNNLYKNPNDNIIASFLLGVKSPFWYRGLVKDYKYYNKIKENELNAILTKYNANKIIIGHTVVDDISTEFQGKVIMLDVKHSKYQFSKNTKGLIIKDDSEYKIDAVGNISLLK